ncbi:MAG: hypothetical protein JNL62_01600 [Bryobacterales bacterium]|nr:hypothetical protein [Bryobacterales bacterium]
MPPRDDSPQALLHRIVASGAFKASNGHAELLQLVCQQTQAGHDLREHDIGVTLFAMEPGYDIAENPIVSATMDETRQWLKAYFAGEGKREPLRLAIPKGEFRAFFYEADPAQLAAAANEPSALDRFWMPYFTNQRPNILLHGALDEDSMLIPEAYAAVQLALLFERNQAHLELIPATTAISANANLILIGTPHSNPAIAPHAAGPIETTILERSSTEQGQIVTILASPQPEGILPAARFAVSAELLESALRQTGPEWPPHFRLTL